jgi:hypothetical protein
LAIDEADVRTAYSEAATVALETCLKPVSKLCVLVCYYPTRCPSSNASFPPSLKVQVHLASSQRFGTKYPSFTYPDAVAGFAEEDLDEYDKVSARLAWSRALGVVREGFGITVDLEKIWEDHLALEFVEKDADKTMATMVAEPYVNHVPTMTGGMSFQVLGSLASVCFLDRASSNSSSVFNTFRSKARTCQPLTQANQN